MNNYKLSLLTILLTLILTGCNEVELKQIDQAVAANNNATEITVATINKSADLSIAQLQENTKILELNNKLQIETHNSDNNLKAVVVQNQTQQIVSANNTKVSLAYVELYNFLSQSAALTIIIAIVLVCITFLLIKIMNIKKM